jgi:hypothetical protein
MPPQRKKPHTTGSVAFDTDTFFEQWTSERVPQDNNLQAAIIRNFNLKSTDDYVYHAIASVTLPQVQNAINHGASNGMHAWYLFDDAKQVRRHQLDIRRYPKLSPERWSAICRYQGVYRHLLIDDRDHKGPHCIRIEREERIHTR